MARHAGHVSALLLAGLVTSAVVGVGVALGWHADDVSVSVACNEEDGTFALSAVIDQSEDWPNAHIVSITPGSLPGDASGPQQVLVKIGWTTSDDTQTFQRTITPDESCNLRVLQTGTVIVRKIMNGGTDTFSYSGTPSGSISEDGGTISETVAPGQYTTTEAVKEGWDLHSISCDDSDSEPDPANRRAIFNVEAGETVTCTFRNKKQTTVIVRKVMIGGEGTFSFSGTPSGSISEDGGTISAGVEGGEYSSTEAPTPGWELVSIDCDDSNSTGDVASRTANFVATPGEVVTCTFTNQKLQVPVTPGSIDVQKSVTPTVLKEPGGPVTYSVRITNTSADADVTITSVTDDRFGSLENVAGGNPAGCFDVPINLAPGQSATCDFPKTITGPADSSHVNVVTASGTDEHGNPVTDSDDARVDITPRLIDLVVVKDASSPTPLNGIVNYSLTVTNKGPDTATNVQLADPAPAGIIYLTANPSQGTCTLSPPTNATMITCSLGTIAAGQTVTIAITARATAVGTHTNTATVTGEGGRETNPADNVDSAVTVVPAPATPPVSPTKPKPQPKPCLTLTVQPKMITADGRPDRVRVLVTSGSKRVKGTKVLVVGSGVRKTSRSNASGIASLTINPKRAGLITITALEPNREVCGAKRIGVVGVFLPPVTG